MRRLHRVVLPAAVLILASVLAAQVRVDVRLVNVVATVMDDRGRYISNLTKDDFTILEDEKRQPISHFSQDRDVPVSVGIVLDTSGSMDRKIRTALDAVDHFIHRIHQADDVFLMTFSGAPVLRQDFTDDREKLSQALRHIPATGGTALYDALTEALAKIRGGRHPKRAILLITDGQDTSSVTKFEEVLRTVRESELLVYPIGISPLTYAKGPAPLAWPVSALLPRKEGVTSKRDEVDFEVLKALAENSGGRAFVLAESFVNRGTQIEKVLNTVADELRSQYTIGYYAPHPDDAQFHSIRIRAKGNVSVRARRGYFSPR